jgi:hypothetical protein
VPALRSRLDRLLVYEMGEEIVSFDESWLKPGGIVPVDIPTTGALVEEVLRLRAVQSETGAWIRVEDRLPPSGESVLVWNGRWRGLGRCMTEWDDESERWQDERSEFIEHLGPRVTHWCPLPESPK